MWVKTNSQIKDEAHKFWQSHNHEQCIIHLLEKMIALDEKCDKLSRQVHELKYKDE